MNTPTIEIQQPKPFDLVGSRILIAGNAAGFEGALQIEVTEGHVSFSGSATAGSLGLAQFQAQIDIPDDPNFQLDRLFVIVSDEGGGEETPPRVFVPVLYGPRILSGYFGYVPHTVAAGETLSSISNQYYETSSQVSVIQRANAHIIDDPNLIFPGQILRIPRN